MVVREVTMIKTKTAMPLKPLAAMKPQSPYVGQAPLRPLVTKMSPYPATGTKPLASMKPQSTIVGPAPLRPSVTKMSPLNLQSIVNPLTKVSLPGTTIPATKTVVPIAQPKGVVGEIAKASTGFGIDVTRVIGSVNPLGGINPLALIGMFQDAFGKKTTTIAPKTGINALKVSYTQAQLDAFKKASEVKLGQWYKQKSPTLLPTIAMMKTKSVLGLIGASGYEINVKGTSDILTQFRDQLNLSEGTIQDTKTLYDNLFAKYVKETGEQTAYIGELSTALETLKASSVEGSIWKAKYEATWQQLQDLLQGGGGGGGGNGNGTTPTDWKSLILYGALAIGGIIVLWALLKGRKGE